MAGSIVVFDSEIIVVQSKFFKLVVVFGAVGTVAELHINLGLLGSNTIALVTVAEQNSVVIGKGGLQPAILILVNEIISCCGIENCLSIPVSVVACVESNISQIKAPKPIGGVLGLEKSRRLGGEESLKKNFTFKFIF